MRRSAGIQWRTENEESHVLPGLHRRGRDQVRHDPVRPARGRRQRGFNETSKAGDVAAWLKDDYGIGRGHAMAFFHVLKNGPEIGDKHVGSEGVHRDESAVLRLDGKANR